MTTVAADPVVSVESIGTPTAGNILTLTCTVTLLQPLINMPSIRWEGPDGSEIWNGTDVTVSDPSFLNSSSVVVFVTYSPLHTSHGGQYRCFANVAISVAGVFISSSSALDVMVQSEFVQCQHIAQNYMSHYSPSSNTDHHRDSNK